jgi:hypothetical protein
VSERRELVCDSCRRRLPLPVAPEVAATLTWRRLSKSIGQKQKTIHLCGQCDGAAAAQRLKDWDGWLD